MRYRLIPWCLLVVLLFVPLHAMAQERYEADRHEAGGVLTEKDSSGRLVINGQEYMLDRRAELYDGEGNSLQRDDLKLESRFYVEYEHVENEQTDTDGVRVIKVMKLIPE